MRFETGFLPGFLEESAAAALASVEALRGTALLQTISVVLGVGVCLFLPRIYGQTGGKTAESGENP